MRVWPHIPRRAREQKGWNAPALSFLSPCVARILINGRETLRHSTVARATKMNLTSCIITRYDNQAGHQLDFILLLAPNYTIARIRLMFRRRVVSRYSDRKINFLENVQLSSKINLNCIDVLYIMFIAKCNFIYSDALTVQIFSPLLRTCEIFQITFKGVWQTFINFCFIFSSKSN